jgi:circadian clock protein KaiC
MRTDLSGQAAIERLVTGVPGLDTVLRGGFLRGGLYIIQGAPGAGKTILGNQICFHQIKNGGRALYVTLLAENHARMMLHIGQLGFFDETAIPDRLYYISAFRVIEENGLSAVQDLLRREIQRHNAGIVILDGFSVIEETAGSTRAFKKFIHELQAQATLADCTMFLLSGQLTASAEHTLVDGVVELQTKLYGRKTERTLQVFKLRGCSYLSGEHSFRITGDGLIVYPRTEAILATPSMGDQIAGPFLATGIPQLDRIMGGGFPHQSTALLVGPPGIGKTTLGLQFLSECSRDTPGLHFGFYETPAAILTRLRHWGCRSKLLPGKVMWRSCGNPRLKGCSTKSAIGSSKRCGAVMFGVSLSMVSKASRDWPRSGSGSATSSRRSAASSVGLVSALSTPRRPTSLARSPGFRSAACRCRAFPASRRSFW